MPRTATTYKHSATKCPASMLSIRWDGRERSWISRAEVIGRAELRSVRWSRLRHRGLLEHKCSGVHETGSTSAVVYYASLGVKVERVMTDNGSCYLSRTFDQTCKKLGLKHIRTKPYTPKTNGKAERFIQTSLREWAYARAYNSSDERTAELPRWLHSYNW